MAAEDADLSLRLLSRGLTIFTDPKIIVHHNRWLTDEEFDEVWTHYHCGEVAAYLPLALRGYEVGKSVIKENFTDSWIDLKAIFGKISKNDRFQNINTLLILKLFVFRLKGFLVGLLLTIRNY